MPSATLVVDYSTGMRKKIGLAAALLSAPRLLVLDEPFEAVDPISAVTVRTILDRFVSGRIRRVLQPRDGPRRAALRHGGGDVEGPHRRGRTLDEVRGDQSLETAFVRLVGEEVRGQEGLSWLA